ncbi:hypothetical protein D3C80_1676170 [compost metagenome]
MIAQLPDQGRLDAAGMWRHAQLPPLIEVSDPLRLADVMQDLQLCAGTRRDQGDGTTVEPKRNENGDRIGTKICHQGYRTPRFNPLKQH